MSALIIYYKKCRVSPVGRPDDVRYTTKIFNILHRSPLDNVQVLLRLIIRCWILNIEYDCLVKYPISIREYPTDQVIEN